MMEKLFNICYTLTANHFQFLRTKKIFKGQVTFECNFQSMEDLKSKFQKIGKDHIIPEIDFAECNPKAIDNVVHYGYDVNRYSTKGKLNHVHKPDGKLHQYAVEMLRDGYNFYCDGYITAKFRSNDPEFVSNHPKYLIINNAVGNGVNKESLFFVKSVKVYK